MFIVFCSLFFGVLFLSAAFYAVASSRSPFCSSSSFPFGAATSKFVPSISILRHDGQGLFHQSFCLSAGYLLSCNLSKNEQQLPGFNFGIVFHWIFLEALYERSIISWALRESWYQWKTTLRPLAPPHPPVLGFADIKTHPPSVSALFRRYRKSPSLCHYPGLRV